MADLHKAILSIHNNAISVSGDTQETIIAKDKDGNEVSINWTQVNSWTDPTNINIIDKQNIHLL